VLLLIRWREVRDDHELAVAYAERELTETAEQLALEPRPETNDELAGRIVAGLPAPTELPDVPAAGHTRTGRPAFPRRPR
jgi:hypothetical protein